MRIPISSIKIPESIPMPTEEQVLDMVGSIKEQGLINPITVRSLNGSYELVAGLVRLKAFLVLSDGQEIPNLDYLEIPAEVKEYPSDAAVQEARLHENLKRAHLPWYVEVELKSKLHQMRQDQHGAAPEGGGRPKKDAPKTWSMRDTAKELGQSLGIISEDIQLAEAVKTDPSLRNVKDKRTAMKLIKRAVKRTEAELGQGIQEYAIPINQVLLGASDTVLAALPPNVFDHCITDPPWLKFHEGGKFVKDQETWPVFVQLFRTLKPSAFLYIFVGFEDFYWYREELPKLGFHVSKTPLIWHKRNAMSRIGVAGWEYDRNFELILVAVKGNPALSNQTQRGSVLDYAVVPTKNLVHPNEKPIELISTLLGDCSYPGSLIVDPFGGSGVVADAAKREDRVYYTIERDQTFYEAIILRLSGAKK